MCNLITSDVNTFLKHSFLEIANSRGGLDGWLAKHAIRIAQTFGIKCGVGW